MSEPRASVRAVIEAIPLGRVEATRYDTDDELVVSLWGDDGTTYDIRIPKAVVIPEKEHTCARASGRIGLMEVGRACGHSRMFHTPGCDCGCPAFVEPPEWEKSWPPPSSGHPDYGRAFDEAVNP